MAEVLTYHTSNGRRTEFTPGMMVTEMDKVNQLGDGTLLGKENQEIQLLREIRTLFMKNVKKV